LIQEVPSGPNSEQSLAPLADESKPHPLFRAAVVSGSEKLVQMHIARGRDVNARDDSGRTLLGLAASKGRLGTIKLLLEAGANPLVRDLKGKNPSEIARANGFYEIVELLSVSSETPLLEPELQAKAPKESDEPTEPDDWEADSGPNEPRGDPEYLARVTLLETKIAEFEYVNPDEDWGDVDADLPEYQLFAGIRKAEFHLLRVELVAFFGAAIVSGTISYDQILSLGDETAELDDEAIECIFRVLDELGIEVVDGIDPEVICCTTDELTEEESEQAENATAYFGDLWSPPLDSYSAFMRDMSRSKLLTGEDEIRLAEAIEHTWFSITKQIFASSQALTSVLSVVDRITKGSLPAGYLLASHSDANEDENVTDPDETLQDSTSEAESSETDEIVDAAATSHGDEWERTLQLIRQTSQFVQSADWSSLAEVAKDAILAPVSEIRFSTVFLQSLVSDLKSNHGETSQSCCRAVQSGLCEIENLRNRFAEANLRLVNVIARKHSRRGVDLLDLVLEGCLGLLKAVERFDHRRGFKFSTYGSWWIKQAITRAIADKARTIRVPVHMVENINKVLSINRRLEKDGAEEVSIDRIAEQLDIPVRKVRKVLAFSDQTSALADLPDEFIESLVDDSASVAWRDVLAGDLRRRSSKVLTTLKPKERYIIVKRFGLEGSDDETLEEVGQAMGVTRERVRQIEAKALRKLRHPVRSRLLEPFLEMRP
jgi:RNA polymerase primary sigma factor